MQVFLVEAEHFSIPGNVFRLFESEESATRYAVEVTNRILADMRKRYGSDDVPLNDGDTIDIPPDATEDTWREVSDWISDNLPNSARAYVSLSDHTVNP